MSVCRRSAATSTGNLYGSVSVSALCGRLAFINVSAQGSSLISRRQAVRAILVSAAALVVLSCRTQVVPTATPLALPPTPTAITFPATPTAIVLPPTPTAITLSTALPPTAEPDSGLSLPKLVALLRPSVVEIVTSSRNEQGVGTGIVIDDRGRILTNWHVIDGASNIEVVFSDGGRVAGHLFREDRAEDLAILTVQKEGLRPVKFGDSDLLEVGESVIAMGYALGLDGGPTVTAGIVSAINRATTDDNGQELQGLIQTDAAINSGNSGGPLANSRGEVIGINTARISAGSGIGFAISANSARGTANYLVSLGPPPPPGYLGAFGADISPTLAVILRLPVSSGVGVEEIDPVSPAAKGGIRIDDIIVGMNDVVIRDGRALSEFLRTAGPGSAVTVRVVRGDLFSGFALIALEITLGGQVG